MNPRELFQAGPHSRQWVDLTASKMWDEAVSYAMAAMMQSSQSSDADMHHKIAGAKMILSIMTTLGEPYTVSREQKQALKH
jgi:NAD-dependent oxidoreductase involved in siderophore biosynthesis